MEAIFKWNWTAFYILVLIFIIIKMRKDKESFYPLKIIGYYFLGTFRFILNNFHIPLGFILFLLFLRNPKKNSQGKRYAAVLGVITLAVSILIPYASEHYYERTRYVELSTINIYDMDFQDQWMQIAKVLELDEDAINSAKVERFNIDYEYNGQLKDMRSEIVWMENQQLYHAYIDYQNQEKKLSVNPSKIPQWVQYPRLRRANDLFRNMDELNLKKMSHVMDIGDKSYLSFYGQGQGNLGASNGKLFILDKEKIIPYTGELPVQCKWFLIFEMRPSGPNSYESHNSHYFLF